MIDHKTAILAIARPQRDLQPLEIDLRLAHEGERRMQEIATANSGNALFLCSIFCRAYDSLGRAYGVLSLEVETASVTARRRRSILVLDRAPAIAKEKGLSSARSPTGSEDVREAICYADEEYCRIEEYRAAVEAAKEMVYCKLQAMRMAHDDVRALVRGTNAQAGNTITHTASAPDTMIESAMKKILEADGDVRDSAAEEPSQPEPSQPEPERKSRGFGKPL